MPIPHVRPERPIETEQENRTVTRSEFIREQGCAMINIVLGNIRDLSASELHGIVQACVKEAEYIWEESKAITM